MEEERMTEERAREVREGSRRERVWLTAALAAFVPAAVFSLALPVLHSLATIEYVRESVDERYWVLDRDLYFIFGFGSGTLSAAMAMGLGLLAVFRILWSGVHPSERMSEWLTVLISLSFLATAIPFFLISYVAGLPSWVAALSIIIWGVLNIINVLFFTALAESTMRQEVIVTIPWHARPSVLLPTASMFLGIAIAMMLAGVVWSSITSVIAFMAESLPVRILGGGFLLPLLAGPMISMFSIVLSLAWLWLILRALNALRRSPRFSRFRHALSGLRIASWRPALLAGVICLIGMASLTLYLALFAVSPEDTVEGLGWVLSGFLVWAFALPLLPLALMASHAYARRRRGA